jgi:hypothetical protein
VISEGQGRWLNGLAAVVVVGGYAGDCGLRLGGGSNGARAVCHGIEAV